MAASGNVKTCHHPLQTSNLAIHMYPALQLMQAQFCQGKILRMKILWMISFETKP